MRTDGIYVGNSILGLNYIKIHIRGQILSIKINEQQSGSMLTIGGLNTSQFKMHNLVIKICNF